MGQCVPTTVRKVIMAGSEESNIDEEQEKDLKTTFMNVTATLKEEMNRVLMKSSKTQTNNWSLSAKAKNHQQTTGKNE